jgi:hypothetical protein
VAIALFCRLDLDSPWDLAHNYIAPAIHDAVEAVAGAVNKIVKDCLGDPMSQALIAKTLQESVFEDSAIHVSNNTLAISMDKGRRFVETTPRLRTKGSRPSSLVFF